MEITDIIDKHVKIGKTSITVKTPGTGKTCGVVRDVCKFKDLQMNRTLDYFKKLRAAGVWGSRIDGLLDCVIVVDNQLYYLHNLNPINTYNKCFAGREGFEDEKFHYEERLMIAENMKQISMVIPCYVD